MKKTLLTVFTASAVMFMACGEAETESTENESNEAPEVVEEDSAAVETVDVALPEGWEQTSNEDILTLAIIDSVGNDMSEFAGKFGAAAGEIMGYIMENGYEMAGAPMSHWLSWDTTAYSVFEVNAQVSGEVVGNDRIQVVTIPAGNALKFNHYGAYEDMGPAHMSINEYFAATGKDAIGGPWEVYMTDPGEEPDTTQWLTEIWYPIGE